MPSGSHKDPPETVALKEEARNLGIQFAPRLGHDKIQELINKYHRGESVHTQEEPTMSTAVAAPPKNQGKLFLTPREYKRKKVQAAKRDAGRLIRIRLTCMNPQKKNWTGEIMSVGSSKVGTFKKFIPFNSDEPYHVPLIIYKHLKNRQCRIGTTQKLPDGREVNRYKLIPEFAIEVLEPLTKKELDELAQRQAMASGTQAN